MSGDWKLKPKLSDVAKHAGVSLATADRVINNRAGVREMTERSVARKNLIGKQEKIIARGSTSKVV